jgi:hypothetical protein
MKEGTDIEEYISKARDLKNLLAMLGEPIPEDLGELVAEQTPSQL